MSEVMVIRFGWSNFSTRAIAGTSSFNLGSICFIWWMKAEEVAIYRDQHKCRLVLIK